jgi:hypothetical protein
VREDGKGSFTISPSFSAEIPLAPIGEAKENMLSISDSTIHPPPTTVKLITLNSFDCKDIERVGGIVMARSVKLLSSCNSSSSKGGKEIRKSWWNEIREEIKSHARFFGCDTVLGYNETNTIDTKEGKSNSAKGL